MSGSKYLDIADELIQKIELGQYPHGSKLPTHRALAKEYGTTPVTISKAYKVLTEQGIIESQVGSGSFVKNRSQLNQVIRAEREHHEYNFSILQPCYAEHLDELLNKFQSTIVDLKSPRLFGYAEDSGFVEHKEAGMKWMSEFGLIIHQPEQVLLTNGAQHALSTLILMFSQPGDKIAMESVTYPGIISIVQELGRIPVAVQMDEHGVIPESLAEVIQRDNISLAIVVPSHQNPTGATMPAERREKIAAIVERFNIKLIEDDIYSFLNDSVLPPIANLLPKNTFYISSLSKAISPGIRCGFIKAPSQYASKIGRFIRSSIWLASPVTFAFAKTIIDDDTATRLAIKQREIARSRQIKANEILGNVAIYSQRTSYQAWIELPNDWKADQFTLAAQKKGVLVSSGSFFGVDPPSIDVASKHIRISLMAMTEEENFMKGLNELANMLAENSLDYRYF